jgi:hypothetical protein
MTCLVLRRVVRDPDEVRLSHPNILAWGSTSSTRLYRLLGVFTVFPALLASGRQLLGSSRGATFFRGI